VAELTENAPQRQYHSGWLAVVGLGVIAGTGVLLATWWLIGDMTSPVVRGKPGNEYLVSPPNFPAVAERVLGIAGAAVALGMIAALSRLVKSRRVFVDLSWSWIPGLAACALAAYIGRLLTAPFEGASFAAPFIVVTLSPLQLFLVTTSMALLIAGVVRGRRSHRRQVHDQEVTGGTLGHTRGT
jgi:hypothetical protein